MKNYLWLFRINFFVSAFTFGGGYVVIPMIRKYFVQRRHVFGEKQLLNMVAVAQSAPGAIAVNLAALASYKTAGMTGAVISCIAAVLPPMITIGIISTYYYSIFRDNELVSAILKGMEAGMAALIIDVVWDMGCLVFQDKNPLSTFTVFAVFTASAIININVIMVIICSLLIYWSIGCFHNKESIKNVG